MKQVRRRAAAVAAAAVLAACVTTTSSGAAQGARAVPKIQLGINTYVTYGCNSAQEMEKWATTQFTKFKSLHANTVAIAWPLYTSSITSNNVVARLDCKTYKYLSPTPAIVGDLVDVAHGLGLRVFLRPLIDQTNLYASGPNNWRGVLAPTNLPAWFTNYFNTVRPYLQIAHDHHVEHFALQTELNSLSPLPNWDTMITASRILYHGDLVWNSSWHSTVPKVARGATSYGIDTYPAIGAPITATSAQIRAKWSNLLVTQPGTYSIPNISKTTIDEIGIPAQVGSYAHPWLYGLPLSKYPFNQTVQVRWFTAACGFFRGHHMRGIYFWGPWLSRRGGRMLAKTSPAVADDIQPATARAIKNCFS